jgi:phosphatidylglycerophosphate synthase
MANKGITLKELIRKQREFILPTGKGFGIYRRPSIPFTYVFLKLGITANTVTLFTYILSIIGYIFLSVGTYLSLLIGLSFFILFYIFDCSDGDVARIQNQKSIEGLFFDEVSHYVWSISLGIGLGQGLSKLYNSEVYLALGVIIALVLTLELAMGFALRSSVRREVIVNKIKTKSPRQILDKISENVFGGKTWSNRNIIVKIFGIFPVRGLIYTLHFFTPLLIILTIAEIFAVSFFDFNLVVGNVTLGLISIYLIIVSLVKLVWVITYLYKMKENGYITKYFKNIKS